MIPFISVSRECNRINGHGIENAVMAMVAAMTGGGRGGREQAREREGEEGREPDRK